MAVYRCAACGSPKIIEEKQAGGYSYKKGIFGTLLLGAGGAAAGINGKQETVYKCLDCGQTLKSCMPESLKNMIDLCMLSTDARNNITIMGEHIDWSTIKRRYPNIGVGVADALSATKNTEVRKNKVEEINDIVCTCDEDVVEKTAKMISCISTKNPFTLYAAFNSDCDSISGVYSSFWSDKEIVFPKNRCYNDIIALVPYSHDQFYFAIALYILKEIKRPVGFEELRDLFYKCVKKVGRNADIDFKEYTVEYIKSMGIEKPFFYPENYSNLESRMEYALSELFKSNAQKCDVNLFMEDNPSEFYFTLANTLKFSNIPDDIQKRLKRYKEQDASMYITTGGLRGVTICAI